MLEATLVNIDGKRAVVHVESWRHDIPPDTLEMAERRFQCSWIGWEPPAPGQPCRATYRQINPTRILNITGMPLQLSPDQPKKEVAA